MPKRIGLSRRAGWRKPEGVVSVARPSRWGNPFRVEEYGQAGAVEKFRVWIEGRVREGHTDLEQLRDLDLACWCKPEDPCHADVLLELANRTSNIDGPTDAAG